MSPSPLEIQLKRASGWKSDRVVTAYRQACRTFSCCSRREKYQQMLLKIYPSLNSPFLQMLSRFITIKYYTIILKSIIYIMLSNDRHVVVIINADDFAYHPDIDSGILQLIRNRSISSLSVIVNTQYVHKAAAQIKQLYIQDPSFQTSFSVGLHLNLTEGKPLSQPINNSQLVQNGIFIGKPKIYQIVKKPDAFTAQQIEEELSAQVYKFMEIFGRRPSHIDGHNHIQIIPSLAELIAPQMSKLGIYKTRIPQQNLKKNNLPINEMFIANARYSKQIYSRNGITYPREFVGLQSFGNISASILKEAIIRQSQYQNGSVELMCHPGFPAAQGSDWIKSKDRLQQKQQLSSQQFKELRDWVGNYQSYYNIKSDIDPQKSTILICLGKQNEGVYNKAMTLKRQFAKNSIDTYFWMKEYGISQHFNRLDLSLLISSIGINAILQITPKEQKYISQQAVNHNIYYLNIRKQDLQSNTSIREIIMHLNLKAEQISVSNQYKNKIPEIGEKLKVELI